jgi:signal transduction histidine kinase
MFQGSTPASDGSFGGAPAVAQPRQAQPQADETSRISDEIQITIQFLRLVNESTGTRDLIRAVTTFFHQQSGCDAVGVRLQEGEDYPYFEARGFPPAFVLAENQLCSRDAAGEIRRDSQGHPVLDCMCGNVICGRFDPAKPFFTAQGSFWTNSTTQLLATTTEADRQARTRNRCNSEGYESVALIPLRLGEQRFGLLQLNARRPGAFSPEVIALWERLGGHLAIALAKFRADDALRDSEARFRSLFENMLEGFAYCRMLFEGGRPRDFIYLHVNEAFGRLTGLKNVVGRRVSEVIAGIRDTDAELFEIYGRVAAAGQPEKFERYVQALKMWFSISVYCPAPEHFVAVFDVITARKEAEEQVRQLNLELEERVRQRTAQLEAANKELEAFSYSVSHDLRAPLRAIDGFAAILVEDHAGRLDPEGRRVVEVIHQEATRMGRLIDDLLAFFRASRGEVRSAAIEITSLARAVFAECADRAPDRKIRLRLDALHPALGDPSLIRQVLTNLISNAIKYTKPRAEAEIELGSRVEGNENVYWIKDNGVGFDPKYTGKLFGIFQRLHSDDQFEGTGVGLALIQRIVLRHGGRVWAEGKLNEGAGFYFTLRREGNEECS